MMPMAPINAKIPAETSKPEEMLKTIRNTSLISPRRLFAFPENL
jgi:hypothetical protein